MLDDVVLRFQRWLDRGIRFVRLGTAAETDAPRLLIVQIDGVSRTVLERALAEGRMPFLDRMLRHEAFRLQPMSVGMPTSTPAFQMAAMYGVRPDIPGFHYHDKRRQTDIHFPRAGHAAMVEADHVQGRPGILTGGSVYGCVFTGGAEHSLFSFAELKRPTGPGVRHMLSSSAVLAWVLVKSVIRTVREIVRSVRRVARHPARRREEWNWLMLRIGISVWVRELFTLAVSRDLYAGAPAVMVNYLDYDVAAHMFGPYSRHALDALREIDRSIRTLARVIGRAPEYRYDLYVFSDHGQAHSQPYVGLTGQPIEHRLFDAFLGSAQRRARAPGARPRQTYAHGFQAYRLGERGLSRRVFARLDRAGGPEVGEREAHQRGSVRVIAAGPNAFLYVLDALDPLPIEAIERRFPGLTAALSASGGVGFILARSAEGPVCYWRGQRYLLGESSPGPFAGREDLALVLRGIAELMAMPSAGDLVIYGTDAPEGHVSYMPEVGAHAGPSPEELHTFLVHPASVTLALPITHPTQLYEHFIQYQVEAAARHLPAFVLGSRNPPGP